MRSKREKGERRKGGGRREKGGGRREKGEGEGRGRTRPPVPPSAMMPAISAWHMKSLTMVILNSGSGFSLFMNGPFNEMLKANMG